MKTSYKILPIFTVLFCSVLESRATTLVDDTWADATRTDPASPNYADNDGVTAIDRDSDGHLESRWFMNGGTTTVSAGHLINQPSSGSTSWTTYFTPEGSEVNLANVGDQLKITWIFTPTGVNAGNTSQFFNFAVVDTPSGSRLTSDGSGPTANYTGYAVFANMGATNGATTSYQLKKWAGISADFLAHGVNWSALTNSATKGAHGYDSGTTYTLVWTFTHNVSGGLDITSTMTGGTLNDTGSEQAVFTDPAPASFLFDTFGVRPSSAMSTATQFDITRFKVEFIPFIIVSPFNITEVKSLPPDAVKLTWDSVNGKTYQIQSTDTLDPISWITNATIDATAASTSYTTTSIPGSVTNRYYRVVATP